MMILLVILLRLPTLNRRKIIEIVIVAPLRLKACLEQGVILLLVSVLCASHVPLNATLVFRSTIQTGNQVNTDSASCSMQTSDTFASHVPLNAIPVFRSTVQTGKHVNTDSASCSRQTSDTFASHVPLNATSVFRSAVQTKNLVNTDSANCSRQTCDIFAAHFH
ncbi:Uncharacterized protein Rs2_46864 [Raphanus sativus]|nr:Uncharacterized protein Rs2_46864 [Raphanus sativus]